MVRFYNPTNGPVSFTFRDGSSGVIPPKAWQEVDTEIESSASIVRLLKQGFLVRQVVDSAPAVSLPSSKPQPPVAKPIEKAPAPKAVVKAEPPKASIKPVEKTTAPVVAPTSEVPKAALKTEPSKPESTSSTPSKDSK